MRYPSFLVAATLSAEVAVCAPAYAEPRAFHAPAPSEATGASPKQTPANVVFVSEAGTPLTISLYAEWQEPGEVFPIVTCRTPCTLRLKPADYRVWADDTADTVAGGRVVTIDSDSRVSVDPSTRGLRNTGRLMLILGPVTSLLGVAVVGYCWVNDCGSTLAWTGVGMFFAGAAVAPVGLILFASSYRTGVTVESERAQSARLRMPRFSAAATPRDGVLFNTALSF